MAKAIFYDPQRKRWKRLRRLMDVLGLAVTLLIVFFLVSALSGVSLTTLLLPEQRRPFKALKENLKEKERKRPKARVVGTKSNKPSTELVLNSGEGVRAAFYVTWDAAA